MLEIVMLVAVVVGIAKAAEMEQMSMIIWGAVALGCCIAAMALMPGWPLVRMMIAGVAAFVIMTGYRLIAER